MNKAILVMDMPEKCAKCPLSKEINTFRPEGICCGFNNEKVSYLDKPDWCPLKPIPEEKDYDYCEHSIYSHERIGFNQCIREILGK